MELAHNDFTKEIGKLTDQLSGVASDICNDVKDLEAINADPRVAPTFAEWSALSLAVNEYSALLTEITKVNVSALRGAAWMAKHGGSSLNMVQINHAYFEGCLNSTSGGRVVMRIKGTFADQPIDGSFSVNLQSPDEGIQQLAKMLNVSNYPKATTTNGSCTRPQVPRPKLSGSVIEQKLEFIGNNKKDVPDNRPKREARPRSAGELRFKD